MRRLTLLLILSACAPAPAQIALPPVRVPSLPAPPLTALQPLERATALPEAQLRRLKVRELLRRHRELLEEDPEGNPIVRGEVLLIAPSEPTLAHARAAGFTVLRESAYEELGVRFVLLKAPGRTARALRQLTRADASALADFNHLYTEAGTVAATPLPAAPAPAPAGPSSTARIGLIDSGVDATHEAFAGLAVQRFGCAGQAVPAAHGTAVASLLVARSAALQGAASGAGLYAADVFCARPQGGAVEEIAAAFAWLAQQPVPVINVSLVGPPNRLLQQVIERVQARGQLIVAAVGNDGPAAPPLYPAALPRVVAVTAVDAQGRVLLEAGRGAHVALAAPGELAAAHAGGGYELVRGTSFAAPLVAGLLARELPTVDGAASSLALAQLERSARAAGGAVPNPVYGFGIVGESLREQPALHAAGLIKSTR